MSLLTGMDWLCLILCLSFGLSGFKRGAINSLIRFGGFIASFIIGKIFSPLLADYLIASGIMTEILKKLNLETLMGNILKTSGQNEGLTWLTNDGASLFDSQEIIETAIAYSLAHFLSFGAILFACSLLFMVVGFLAKGITGLPVIGKVDSLLGLFLGLLSALVLAFLLTWIFSLIDLYASPQVNVLNYQSSVFYQKIVMLFGPT